MAALTTSYVSSACRRALQAQNHDFCLKGGAKAFVYPEQYTTVKNAVRGRQLKPRHIIVAADFMDAVLEATASIGKGVEVKKKEGLYLMQVDTKGVPSSMYSQPSRPSAKSSTDANPRTRIRPREKARRP